MEQYLQNTYKINTKFEKTFKNLAKKPFLEIANIYDLLDIFDNFKFKPMGWIRIDGADLDQQD